MEHDSQNRRVFRTIVYTMLAMSAGSFLLTNEALWNAAQASAVPLWMPLIAPAAFTLFVMIYAVERWQLVFRRGCPLFRALFPVAFAAAFLPMLWPQQLHELEQARATRSMRVQDRALRLLANPSADVRALACEVLGLRQQIAAAEAITALANSDGAVAVRTACAQAFDKLKGAANDVQSGPQKPAP